MNVQIENLPFSKTEMIFRQMLEDFKLHQLNGSIELHFNNGVIAKIKKNIVENV